MGMLHWLDVCPRLLRWLAPYRCAACDVQLTYGGVWCDACERGIDLRPRHRSLEDCEAWACADYGGAIKQAIHRFKFGRTPQLAPRLARVMTDSLAEAIDWNGALAVPVPMHARRLALRGYNHAALLARYLSEAASIRVDLRGLQRLSDTTQQSRLERAERLVNLDGQFRAKPRLAGAQVLLVDDVLTTGATALACARALREAGAHLRAVITLAHTR